MHPPEPQEGSALRGQIEAKLQTRPVTRSLSVIVDAMEARRIQGLKPRSEMTLQSKKGVWA